MGGIHMAKRKPSKEQKEIQKLFKGLKKKTSIKIKKVSSY